MNPKKVQEMLSFVIAELKDNAQWGTAHVYQSTLNSFSLFNKGKELSFDQLTPGLLKEYEIYLRRKQCSWGTVATYMKVLKAVYNRALDNGDAVYVPRLFRQVCTSAGSERKKALDMADMRTLLRATAQPASHLSLLHNRRKVLLLFSLMFLLRGIPFVDLAYLKKTDIRGNVLTYRRRKTGRLMEVELVAEACDIIQELGDNTPDYPYLFPILRSPEGTHEAYREYQSALRTFNRTLYLASGSLLRSEPLTTYSARHTWATLAYHCEINPGIISEAMGHSSISITETYLKPFRNEKIDAANRFLISRLKEDDK